MRVFFDKKGSIVGDVSDLGINAGLGNALITFDDIKGVRVLQNAIEVVRKDGKLRVSFITLPMWVSPIPVSYGSVTNGDRTVYFIITDAMELDALLLQKMEKYAKMIEWDEVDDFMSALNDAVAPVNEEKFISFAAASANGGNR